MTDTLILFKPLADFGEALKKECPKNDCTSYLYTYEQYCAIYADYKRIKETIADLSEAAVRVLEHADPENGSGALQNVVRELRRLETAGGAGYGGKRRKAGNVERENKL